MTRLEPATLIGGWRYGAPFLQELPGHARPMDDRVTYRFQNGWVQTGDLPCRQALREMLPSRRVDKPEGPFSHAYVGAPDGQVDFSRFCHRPTLISRPFQTLLNVENAGIARLGLETAGGIHLWLNDTKVAAFEPYQRNQGTSTEVSVALAPGRHWLTVLMEDLHERDTACFFSLAWLDGPVAAVELAVDDTVRSAVATLDGLVTDRVFQSGGKVRLVASRAVAEPIDVTVSGIAPFERGGMVARPGGGLTRQVTFGPENVAAEIFDVSEVPAGCLALNLSCRVGETRIDRRLGVTVLPDGIALTGELEDRKAQARGFIKENDGFDPSVALLLAVDGSHQERVAEILAAVLPTVEERFDCADFSILPLLRLWRDARHLLDPAMAERIKRAVLGFRYWMTEPGNDVMWFWSENHVLCFQAAQAIAGGLFPEEFFSNSGKTGRVLRQEALVRLGRWFDSIDVNGLGEWNSAAYYPIDFLALFSLYDMESATKDRAAQVLDRIFEMVALHSSGGVPAGSQGRCYEKELLAGPATELGPVAAIAFGGRYWPGYDRASALFVLSDYGPPQGLADLAWPRPGEAIEARYAQGADQTAKLSLWKSSDGQLSTATGLDVSSEGHQAHVLDVQMSSHPMARLWINHPGDRTPWGERRPSLLAGNHVLPAVAQFGSTALMVFDLDRPWTDIRYSQLFAFADAFDGIDGRGDWKVFRSGSGCVAVWCSVPLIETGGLYRGALWKAAAVQHGWIVEMSLPGEAQDAFETRLTRMAPQWESGALHCCDSRGRSLRLDVDGLGHIDQKQILFREVTVIPAIRKYLV